MVDGQINLLAAQVASVLVIMQIISVVIAARIGKLGLILVSSTVLTAAAVVFAMLPFAAAGPARAFCLVAGLGAAGSYAFFFQKAVARLQARIER